MDCEQSEVEMRKGLVPYVGSSMIEQHSELSVISFN